MALQSLMPGRSGCGCLEQTRPVKDPVRKPTVTRFTAVQENSMSRIGKKPIPLPKGVTYTVEGNVITVNGPKGTVTNHLPGGVTLTTEDGVLLVQREDDSKAAVHGLVRALVNNAVVGVTTGWTRELEIVGIGYRAELKGKGIVVFSLGYSHPIEYPLPSGIEVAIDPKMTKLSVSGIDRQKLGQVAAEMRSLRPPDPYKQKGVRYAGEKLKKKVGKTGAK
jgi:large subunit ribosomal protein L6